VRRATTWSATLVPAASAWGKLSFEPTETRLLAPYADEPLESCLIARLIRPGMCVFDIGANRGWYTLMASRRVGTEGRVVAVEPDPRMIARLRGVIEDNHLPNVEVLQAAISSTSGQRRFVLQAEPSLNHLAAIGEGGEATSRLVDVLTFEEACERSGLAGAHFIKVDTEGTEPEVLMSVLDWCRRHEQRPFIMFEHQPELWTRSELDGAAVLNELEAAGFDLLAIDYAAGGLTEFRGSGVHAGRNLLAVPAEARAAVSTTVQWGFPP
jgi:FkbM family methyltransferase